MSRPDDRLDAAIDRTVREMLDVEPPAGLRGRVMQQIDPVVSGFSRKPLSRTILWAGLPLAAAAALILALLLPRTESQPQAPATVVSHPAPRVDPPAPRVGPLPVAVAQTTPASPRRAAPRATQPRNVIAATNGATDVIFGSDPAFPSVDALTIPALTVPTLRTVSSVRAPQELALDPIATPAPLGIEPLPLTPPSRHEQEHP